MKKNLILFLVSTVLLVGACSNENPYAAGDSEPDPSGELKEFTMTAKQFAFEPNAITVNQGDTVRLIVTSVDVAHGIAIPEYGVNAVLQPGKTETIEFTADTKGRFPFLCSVSCGIGHRDMRGQIVVQ